MVIYTIEERFHYMRGYFKRVCQKPECYLKEDLIFYIKELRKFLDSPDKPLNDDIIGRSIYVK